MVTTGTGPQVESAGIVLPKKNKESLELLCELPTIEPIIEDELHVLTECSLYDDTMEVSSLLKQTTKSVIEVQLFSVIEPNSVFFPWQFFC